MKVGITLPQFSDDPREALAAARRAEAIGIDGVFCFDHLWPMGQPGRPVLSSGPLLGAVAASTSVIALGTLVARVGVLPDDVLVASLVGLSAMCGGRFIAGIGTGDRLSRAENDAYGVPYERAEVRRLHLGSVATAVAGRGVPVWIGGGGEPTVDVARRTGAAVNVWEGGSERVSELVEEGLQVTWGGPAGRTEGEVTARLLGLAAAGARWAVCAWPDTLEPVAAAAAAVRTRFGPEPV